MAKVLRISLLPDYFFGVLSAQFQVTDANGAALTTEQLKGGGIHAFLGRLATDVAPVPSLTGLTFVGVYRDRVSHTLHSFFSVPVGPYDLYRQLFGFRGELPPEGLPTITDIPVDSFSSRRGVGAMPLKVHIIHPEGASPSS